jgi:hypothetical protein
MEAGALLGQQSESERHRTEEFAARILERAIPESFLRAMSEREIDQALSAIALGLLLHRGPVGVTARSGRN